MDQNIKDARSLVAAAAALGMAIGKPLTNPNEGGGAYVLLPQGNGEVKLEYLKRHETPTRKRGTITVSDAKSFIEAVDRHTDKNSLLYARKDNAQVTAVLNDNTRDGPNWRDHRIVFPFRHSDEFAAWDEHNKKEMTQVELAYFIEDQGPDFKDPMSAKMLEIALNIRVKQAVHFKSGIRQQDGTVQFEYTEENQTNAGPQQKFSVPETFKIAIPVWDGLGQKKYEFMARLRYKLAGGQLRLRYELVRPEKVVEQAFADTLDEIKKGLKDTPVIFGDPA